MIFVTGFCLCVLAFLVGLFDNWDKTWTVQKWARRLNGGLNVGGYMLMTTSLLILAWRWLP